MVRFKQQDVLDFIEKHEREKEAYYAMETVRQELSKVVQYEEEVDRLNGRVRELEGVIDVDREFVDTGRKLRIDCTKFGSGAYSIPISVEHLEFETKAKFILVIETAGMFQRLVKHNYWKRASCILVSMGGVPTRACRRFIRRLSDVRKIPVYVFVDGDPYGMMNIYRTLKVGSGNAAHINKFFCVPDARYLGITPDQVRHIVLAHQRGLGSIDYRNAGFQEVL